MGYNEEKKDSSAVIDKNSQIQVIVNKANSGEYVINLGRVFRRMKLKTRVFAWLLLLCIAVGICAPLLLYQFSREPLTVSSVVTLSYNAWQPDPTDEESDELIRMPVQSLIAPDGTDLDLTQVKSILVLQEALNSMGLPEEVTALNVLDNLSVERILTEKSRQQQEVIARMIEGKESGAYAQIQELELDYTNQFVVSLKNRFGQEDSRIKVELEDDELRELLDRILNAYNVFLVKTYRDLKLPDDEISVIDIKNLDYLQSLDLLRNAEDHLYAYCEEMPDDVLDYRSWRNGKSLSDWMDVLKTAREVDIDYLYARVYDNAIAKDRNTALTGYCYELRNAQAALDTVNKDIASVRDILAAYKNDEVIISVPESDTSYSTRVTTAYYNQLVLEQAENYELAASLETKVRELEEKIAALEKETEPVNINGVEEELVKAVGVTYSVYLGIRDHMQEIIDSAAFNTFAVHTAVQGRVPGFLQANVKKIVIGIVLGALIACGFWFLSALAPEFRHEDEKKGKSSEEVRA